MLPSLIYVSPIYFLIYVFYIGLIAFKVGPYAITQNDQDDVVSMCNQNCFIYATFHESIYIYPNQFV